MHDTADGDACGWFGKLACLGDFGSRRLPRDFVERCDAWLSSGLAASREQLGEAWLDTYLGAPLWHFAWSPGIAGPDGWLGVLMPSVDSIGRYFPLIAARPAATLPATPAALAAVQAWFDHVGDAVLGTLRQPASVADFEAGLASAPRWEHLDPAESRPVRIELAGRTRHESTGPLDVPAWHCAAGDLQLRSSLAGRSLWLARSPRGGPSSLSVAQGLPAPGQFVDLLRGSW